jgi:DNA topoisomerase II
LSCAYSQLTGYVAEHSAYHHGEQSLQQTIVGLAQNFVGSNNVNLLTPSGQFGTRRMGGKDAASPRYIFTCLEPIARAIFHPDDDDLLTYLNDDGVSIEPEYYVPVIPMVLVNGSDGIGTGYSSAISNYDPREIISNLRRKLNGEQFLPMNPNYYGFDGDILPDDKKAGTFKVLGKIERIDDTTLFISELPLKKWTQDYKQFLETMLTGGEKQPPEIKDFKENHTESTVRFTVTMDKEKLDEFEKDKAGLMGKFKLSSSLSTSNMNLFDPDKRIVKYATPEDIMTEFFQVRLDFYMKRKVRLVEKLEREQRMLSNKARFVEEVCSGALVVSNRKRKELLADLHERGYDTFLPESKKKAAAETNDDAADSDSDDDENVSGTDLGKGYDYLLGMKIWSLTYEKAEKIRAELAEKTAELETLKATSPEQLWLNDLVAVEAALDQRDVQFAKSAKDEERAQKKNKTRQTNKKAAARQSKKTKKDEWDSEMELSSDPESDDDASVAPVRARKPAASRPIVATKKAKASPVSKPKAVSAPAPAAKKPPQASIAHRPLASSGAMDLDSDSDVENRKPAAKEVAPVAASKKPVTKKAAIESPDDSDDESVEELGLKDRLMSKKMAASPKSKSAAAAPAKKPSAVAKNAKKRPSPKNDDEDSDDEMDGLDDVDFVLASVTPAKGRVAGKASKTNQVAKKARSKAPAPEVDLTADSDLDLEFHSDGDMAPAKKPAPARARSGRAILKQPVYNVDSDDESDDYGGSSDSD